MIIKPVQCMNCDDFVWPLTLVARIHSGMTSTTWATTSTLPTTKRLTADCLTLYKTFTTTTNDMSWSSWVPNGNVPDVWACELIRHAFLKPTAGNSSALQQKIWSLSSSQSSKSFICTWRFDKKVGPCAGYDSKLSKQTYLYLFYCTPRHIFVHRRLFSN